MHGKEWRKKLPCIKDLLPFGTAAGMETLRVIYTFLALSTQWMSSPSRKWRHGISSRFHLVVFVFAVPKSRRELEGKGSPRFPAPMVESFSVDLPPAIESCWTELRLKFCQTSATELLCGNVGSAFRWLH